MDLRNNLFQLLHFIEEQTKAQRGEVISVELEGFLQAGR